MKKVLLLGMAIAIFAVTSQAQETKEAAKVDAKVATDKKEAPKMDRAEWDKKLKDELKLTEEQSAKYDAIAKECYAKIDALQADASLTEEVQKEKKMALKKEKEKKLLEILTPEQQASYKAMMEKKKKG